MRPGGLSKGISKREPKNEPLRSEPQPTGEGLVPRADHEKAFAPIMLTKIDEKLYLGDALDAKLLQRENPLHIKAVVNVSYDQDEPVDGINNVHVPMMDNGRIPAKAFDFALSAIAENLRSGPVLVHCAMGVSRSVVVVALYLALNSRISLDTALERVQQLHAQANPASGTVDSGKRYFNHW